MISSCLRVLVAWVMFLMLAGGPGAWEAAAQIQGRTPAQLWQEAEQLYRTHRYDEALARYEQFLRTSPPETQGQLAWLRTAEIYGIRGDWPEARRRYEALLMMKTDSGVAQQARYGVGQAHYKMGNLPEAERVLENLSASVLPAALRFKTNALLVEISLQAGNVPQAFSRLLLAAKDVPPGEEEWFADLQTRLWQRASLAELTSLADLYRDTPLTPGLLLQLAKLELQAGRLEQAATWLKTLQERFPQSPEAAQAKQLTGGLEQAKPPAQPGAVGCLLPLSGSEAEAGRQVQNGVELAAEQAGVPLIIVDYGSEAEGAAAAVADLAANPQVAMLLGFFPSAAAEAAASEAQQLRIPLLALTQKKDLTLGRPLVFRDFLTHRLMIQALVHHTANRQGWQRYAILAPDSPYGRTLARLFGEEINRQAARLVGQATYREGGADLAQAVQTLAQMPAPEQGGPAVDAIFIPDEAKIIAALSQELARTPLQGCRLLGTNILAGPDTLRYQEHLAGLLFVDGFLAGEADPAAKAFAADYRQKYKQSPGYLAAQGYSSLRLLAAAISQRPDANREELASTLHNLKPPAGFTLFQGFTHEREAEVATVIITIGPGHFTRVQ